MSTKQSELGIGQVTFADSRHKMVDYLPAMYMYELFMQSKKPGQIAAYDTIFYPFDEGTWIFTIVSLVAMFSVLLVMQNIWSMLSGNENPKDYIFAGNKHY